MRILVILLSALLMTGAASLNARPSIYGPAQTTPTSSGTFVHDGVTLYYETYGAGEPLLMVHGNGGSISNWAGQIAHFRKRYRVIAMDSRDQGRSGNSVGPITYEKMADDLAALLDHLGVKKANILGWSDGGIEALLLGMRHPSRANRIIAMAANLNPDAVYPETSALAVDLSAQAAVPGKSPVQAAREAKVAALLANEPHIDPKQLAAIMAPTLVLASDHDLILDTHTLDIFHNLPNSQLGIIPDATHMIPFDDPARFNALVETFLARPFVKKDRIADFLKSYEAMTARQK